jgi:hypothetical protein
VRKEKVRKEEREMMWRKIDVDDVVQYSPQN